MTQAIIAKSCDFFENPGIIGVVGATNAAI
jgi:hypothetical protein